MSRLHAIMASTVLATGGLGLATASQAQTAAPASAPQQVAEVVITAEKRSERIQDVPVAVTAFNAKTLRRPR